jgi:multidrug efflux pump subunit AcrA (membrane-fusion protein)
MRQGRRLVLAVAGLLIIVFFTYTFLRSPTSSPDPAAAPKPKSSPPAPVYTKSVQRGTISQQILATGDIRADARVEVFPKVEGHLRDLQVEEGDPVQAGNVLAHIVDDELQAQVARAKAQVDALQAEWNEMQAGARPEEIAQAVDRVKHTHAELENAQWMMERMRTMAERGLQSTQELEDATRKVTQAQALYNTAQKQLALLRAGARDEERQALQARLRAAQEAVNLANVELQNAVITSPMDGIVGRRYVDPGAYVTTSNPPIVTIVAMRTVKVRVPISERDLGKIRPGLTAHLRVDAYPEATFTGKVQRVSPLIDPASRSGEVEISIGNPDYRLKPGMFAKVAVMLQQRQDVVVIPRDALRMDAQGGAVFVVENGVAHLRRVVTGLQTDTEVEILEALAPGTEIVVAGHYGLKDQAPVRVVQAKE